MGNSENDKQGDQPLFAKSEAKTIQTADAQDARNAGVQDVKAVQSLNRNAHDGSAGGDQGDSLKVIAVDEDGHQVVIAERPREPKPSAPITIEQLKAKALDGNIWARSMADELATADKLSPGERQTSAIAKILKKAELMFGNGDKTTFAGNVLNEPSQQKHTGGILAVEAKNNPAAEPVALYHEWAHSLPPGPERDAYKQEVRELASQISPDMREKMSDLARSRQLADTTGQPQTEDDTQPAVIEAGIVQNQYTPQAAWEAIQKLPAEQQQEILQDACDTFIQSFQGNMSKDLSEMGQEMWNGAVRASFVLLGTALEAGQLAWDLNHLPNKMTELIVYSALNQREKAGEVGTDIGDTIGKSIVFGLMPIKSAYDFGYQWGFSGDSLKPVHDFNNYWNKMTPAQQAGAATEMFIIWELPAKGMKLAGSGQFAEAFNDMNNVRKTMSAQKFAECCQKSQQKMAEIINKHFGPPPQGGLRPAFAAASASEGSIQATTGAEIANSETALMSKADGVGSSRIPKTGVDASGKALAFSEESEIELGAARLGQDQVWEQLPVHRGNDVHVVLGENLPSGFKTLDRILVKDGIAEGQKSIDLTLESYQNPGGLYSKLKTYAGALKIWDGQKQTLQRPRLLEQEFDQKILHIGIKDGSMTAAQKEVFEQFAKEEILEYNKHLPLGKAPIKLKVTVVK